MQILEAGLVYFALVFGLGFILGSIRVPFIVPRLGQRKAELLEMPFMLVGIMLAARFVLKQFVLPNTILAYLSVGILALSLVLIAELLMLVALQGNTIKQYFKNRDSVSGSVYMLLLIVFALMPLIIMNNM
jgi:dolichyl-phosphate-mannose--protein O-mannosyl transferase